MPGLFSPEKFPLGSKRSRFYQRFFLNDSRLDKQTKLDDSTATDEPTVYVTAREPSVRLSPKLVEHFLRPENENDPETKTHRSWKAYQFYRKCVPAKRASVAPKPSVPRMEAPVAPSPIAPRKEPPVALKPFLTRNEAPRENASGFPNQMPVNEEAKEFTPWEIHDQFETAFDGLVTVHIEYPDKLFDVAPLRLSVTPSGKTYPRLGLEEEFYDALYTKPKVYGPRKAVKFKPAAVHIGYDPQSKIVSSKDGFGTSSTRPGPKKSILKATGYKYDALVEANNNNLIRYREAFEFDEEVEAGLHPGKYLKKKFRLGDLHAYQKKEKYLEKLLELKRRHPDAWLKQNTEKWREYKEYLKNKPQKKRYEFDFIQLSKLRHWDLYVDPRAPPATKVIIPMGEEVSRITNPRKDYCAYDIKSELLYRDSFLLKPSEQLELERKLNLFHVIGGEDEAFRNSCGTLVRTEANEEITRDSPYRERIPQRKITSTAKIAVTVEKLLKDEQFFIGSRRLGPSPNALTGSTFVPSPVEPTTPGLFKEPPAFIVQSLALRA